MTKPNSFSFSSFNNSYQIMHQTVFGFNV